VACSRANFTPLPLPVTYTSIPIIVQQLHSNQWLQNVKVCYSSDFCINTLIFIEKYVTLLTILLYIIANYKVYSTDFNKTINKKVNMAKQ